VEQWILTAALGSIVLHFAFVLYLLGAVVLLVETGSYWLERRPHNHKHLTGQGVSYRPYFLEKEQEFAWNEVDVVRCRGCLHT
jgi:hypothetical protein